MRRGISLTLALLMTLGSSAAVKAQTSLDISYNAAEESITAIVDTDKKEKTAVLTVEKDGRFYVIAEFERTSTTDFSYTSVLPFDCPSGKYTAKVTIGSETATDDFDHINTGLAILALESINGANKNTLADVIRTVGNAVAVDVEEFNEYESSVVNLFYLYKPQRDITPAEFSVLYQKVINLSKLKAFTDYEATELFLKNNSSEIEFDYARFSLLSKEEKEEIAAKFNEGNYSENDVTKEYEKWFCVADINSKRASSVAVYKEAILTTHNTLLMLDTEDFSTCNDPGEVIRQVMATNYNNIEDIRSAFYAAVENVGQPLVSSPENGEETSGGGSSGGGGAGSGANRGSSIINPPVKEENQFSNVFADVDETHWCSKQIAYLYEKGIINGKNQKSFCPEDFVTRAEFSKMIIEAMFADEKVAVKDAFMDVNENDWYYEYINKAYGLNIINGTQTGKFNPQSVITRQDMAVILYRALGKKTALLKADVDFTDIDEVSGYAKEAVSALKNKGIINGMENNSFKPFDNLTRAQAAKVLYEVLNSVL